MSLLINFISRVDSYSRHTFCIIHFSRIAAYATTHTADSVYIIGGIDNHWKSVSAWDYVYANSRIAKFQENIWSIAGYLQKGRVGHKSITVSGNAIILGGDQFLLHPKWYQNMISPKSDIELWDLVSILDI